MRWEDLTVEGFKEALTLTKGVAVIPIGCLEKHGYHIPLGTDMTIARVICERATDKEDALLVPIAPYGIISEAQHKLGTLSISSKLQYELLEELCDELARNGYYKIIIVNGHGGATHFTRYFAQSRLEKRHPYIVYVINAHYRTVEQYQHFIKNINKEPLRGSGHADLMETSEMLYHQEDKCNMNHIVFEQTQDYERGADAANLGLFSAIGWYADHPEHVAGDPTGASKEKGEFLTNMYVENLSKAIKYVKDDDTLWNLTQEFYDKMENPEI